MRSTDGPVGPAEYLEPRCVLCGPPYGEESAVQSIPQKRILEKLDEYMGRRDLAGAERHLLYWLEEAKAGNDKRGELLVRGELIGHFRKTGQREKALEQVDAALPLLPELGMEETQSAGTTYVNAATACNAFGEDERALDLFARAREIYEADDRTAPELLGGLYNNMALTCVALGRYDEARTFYGRALTAMRKVENGQLEEAITQLNLASAVEAELGAEAAEEEITKRVEKAYELLTQPYEGEEGYYAFVCEKCAPSFSYYGFFPMAKELERRAEEIYRRKQEA